MTLVLLDTNIYLRLAKRIRPMLGVKFGHKEYVVTILKDVEDEVHRNSTLRFKYPWFGAEDLAAERMATQVRLSKEEKSTLDIAQSVLYGMVQSDILRYTSDRRSPPSPTDCRVLAFGQIRPAIVVTDDLGMHALAKDFGISIWHGPDLLSKMLSAKKVSNDLAREIYAALEDNRDLTDTWIEAKHTTFAKIFGKAPEE